MDYGDITIQNQSDFLPVNFVGSFTRDMTAVSGSQSITGIGFKPKSLLLIGAVALDNFVSISISDGTNSKNIFRNPSALTWSNNSTFIVDFVTAGASQEATLTSLDTDGFTINWTKNGSPPAGTATIQFMAFK